MSGLSTEQILDASGTYGEAAVTSGVTYERRSREVPYPSFAEAKRVLGIEAPLKQLVVRQADLAATAAGLRRLGGLRVMVGAQTAEQKGYFPGVILPDDGQEVRIGCLKASPDIRPADPAEAVKPLSDLQHILLGKIAAAHLPRIGEHGSRGTVNGAEIGHAVLVGATLDASRVHANVHAYTGHAEQPAQRTPSLLSAKVASTGATHLRSEAGERPNYEHVFKVSEVSHLIIVENHQLPWPLEGDAFDLAAGVTRAAVRTHARNEQPNLRANFDNLLVTV